MKSFLLCALSLVSVAADRVCNNSPSLCSKPYDTITHFGAHDSPFLRDQSTSFSSFGNQFFNSTTQLDAGVRLLSTQIHVATNENDGKRELHICHTSCSLFDAGPLQNWLWGIRGWIDAHPNDVVTILLVNYGNADAREIEEEYSKADIAHYGYVPQNINKAVPLSNETHPTWPTLSNMIERGERLVTFVNPVKPDKENAPYLLNEFTFLWENAYAISDPKNFTCQPDRPEHQTIYGMHKSGRLFLMNHFLYWQQAFGIQVPDVRNINSECANQVTRQPTFVLVDFFNVGAALKSIDIFNKVEQPVGRPNVTGMVVIGGRVAVERTSEAARPTMRFGHGRPSLKPGSDELPPATGQKEG
ncbi:hypothetical protein K505DRAFT_375569 [Melanomma pulvis-pyrius CBS 109.77]|uniref:PLC-like phosphodiesterase n=1 Tax=Melanomma pulvis-pyrius CBS 109.77 TaxID=1314802 RepID=A0A6A6X982_9PLEO|nr:hypothetical protein K505DRAFT_375569 [Melanomma pulvis-pyrius CBS 109.77]